MTEAVVKSFFDPARVITVDCALSGVSQEHSEVNSNSGLYGCTYVSVENTKKYRKKESTQRREISEVYGSIALYTRRHFCEMFMNGLFNHGSRDEARERDIFCSFWI